MSTNEPIFIADDNELRLIVRALERSMNGTGGVLQIAKELQEELREERSHEWESAPVDTYLLRLQHSSLNRNERRILRRLRGKYVRNAERRKVVVEI